MGPGRWGSRGDIKLGVSVTYADINNTAMLIEIARRSGDYVPDVSFGTHFFQDLVEATSATCPCIPTTRAIVFNERFLLGAENILADLLPEYADLSRGRDPGDRRAGGRPTGGAQDPAERGPGSGRGLLRRAGRRRSPCGAGGTRVRQLEPIQYWRWRKQMAERIAAEVDHERLGVQAMYLFGSVKNATAGPASDIDLLIHFTRRRRPAQSRLMTGWTAGAVPGRDQLPEDRATAPTACWTCTWSPTRTSPSGRATP